MTEQQPSLGRIVHYILPGGTHRAAIMSDVGVEGRVDLTVFTQIGDRFATGVTYQLTRRVENVREDQSCTNPESWHWPERV